MSYGRVPGVSNSFASALWSLGEMLVDASIGVQSLQFHHAGGNSTATLLAARTAVALQPLLTVQPIYYGLRFFALATADHSTVYRVKYTNADSPHVKVYASISRHGGVQLVVLHKHAGASHDALVTMRLALPVAFTRLPYARITRRSAPSASSVDGVTLGGQTYDGNIDGEARGEAVEEWAEPVKGGYSAVIGRLSAVLLRLDPAGPYRMGAAVEAHTVGSALGVGEQHASMWPSASGAVRSSSDEGTASVLDL